MTELEVLYELLDNLAAELVTVGGDEPQSKAYRMTHDARLLLVDHIDDESKMNRYRTALEWIAAECPVGNDIGDMARQVLAPTPEERGEVALFPDAAHV